ncbi:MULTISPECIES: helix-turn-helix domain-containing protein [Calothrix]|uniref:Helix-turn-helix transcriptional regulator n=2 Tax=Calothrix TaxID=1186 RepID=A0ABR8A448_9CYAN|nr:MULTISPECIES: AraC family transcriptional regulator [Calothrix]MBD2194624.1 helix-turn-helix transcriptional regulator [Calothrix parietina FACHB-288]MBD2223270.1 helix-turn-helix transcriptional regulator [Calothrix anomala FACHB-343]
MTDILINDTNFETQTLLMRCLENAGFEIINIENGIVKVGIFQNKTSQKHNAHITNYQKSIFPNIARLNEVFEFIELNYHQNISLKEVAQAVGYSSAYLTDLVRKLTGKTVNNWIIERRIIQASNLLLETNYSVEEIALQVGYQNINHFYCQFRDYYKNTPRAWRENHRRQVS